MTAAVLQAPEPRTVPVELLGVHFSYGRDEVLRGVDLALGPGEICSLVGDNGAGKSTIAHGGRRPPLWREPRALWQVGPRGIPPPTSPGGRVALPCHGARACQRLPGCGRAEAPALTRATARAEPGRPGAGGHGRTRRADGAGALGRAAPARSPCLCPGKRPQASRPRRAHDGTRPGEPRGALCAGCCRALEPWAGGASRLARPGGPGEPWGKRPRC